MFIWNWPWSVMFLSCTSVGSVYTVWNTGISNWKNYWRPVVGGCLALKITKIWCNYVQVTFVSHDLGVENHLIHGYIKFSVLRTWACCLVSTLRLLTKAKNILFGLSSWSECLGFSSCLRAYWLGPLIRKSTTPFSRISKIKARERGRVENPRCSNGDFVRMDLKLSPRGTTFLLGL